MRGHPGREGREGEERGGEEWGGEKRGKRIKDDTCQHVRSTNLHSTMSSMATSTCYSPQYPGECSITIVYRYGPNTTQYVRTMPHTHTHTRTHGEIEELLLSGQDKTIRTFNNYKRKCQRDRYNIRS